MNIWLLSDRPSWPTSIIPSMKMSSFMKGFASFCVRTSVMSPKTMKRIGKIAPVMIANTLGVQIKPKSAQPRKLDKCSPLQKREESCRSCRGTCTALPVPPKKSLSWSWLDRHVNIKMSRHNGCLAVCIQCKGIHVEVSKPIYNTTKQYVYYILLAIIENSGRLSVMESCHCILCLFHAH